MKLVLIALIVTVLVLAFLFIPRQKVIPTFQAENGAYIETTTGGSVPAENENALAWTLNNLSNQPAALHLQVTNVGSTPVSSLLQPGEYQTMYDTTYPVNGVETYKSLYLNCKASIRLPNGPQSIDISDKLQNMEKMDVVQITFYGPDKINVQK